MAKIINNNRKLNMSKNSKMLKVSDYLEILNEYKLLKEAHNVLEMKYRQKCNEIYPLELENEWLSNRNGDLAELNQRLEERLRVYEEAVAQNKRVIEELRYITTSLNPFRD
jgi:chromosome condensin MukBEF ATPase and DNA-binding subunit MukB